MRFFVSVLAALALAALARGQEKPPYEKLAPYAAIRWSGDAPEVEAGGRWRALVAIDGVESSRVVEFCRATYADRWRKRFEEDLVEVFATMGKPLGAAVDLSLRDLDGGAVEVAKGVAMTKENRTRILEAARARSATAERVRREHARPPEGSPYADLARWADFEEAPTLSRADVEDDLDELELLVDRRFAYRDRLGVDVHAAFDAVQSGAPERAGRGAFAAQIQKLLARFGDGHTRVEGLEPLLPRGYLPFLVSDTAQGLVAFREDRSAFVDAEHPILRAIDGRPVEAWLEIAGRLAARGAPHFARFQAVRNLRLLGWMRSESGAAASAKVRIEVGSLDGASTRALELEVAAKKPVHGAWPRRATGRLDGSAGDVGYLRIASMDEDPAFVDGLARALEALRGTRALVIDVRGNGGGSREPLRRLLPYFARNADGPRVYNVAACLVEAGSKPGGELLADRGLFNAESKRWSDASRAALAAFAKSFRPEWTPAAGAPFSEWHFAALEPGAQGAPWTYAKPVLVLCDTGCFSATDVFLGAFADLTDAKLVGEASGGGSGRPRGATLAHSRIEVQLSSMASFRADGRLYDSAGVEPDVVVRTGALDVIGRGDAVLEAALAELVK